MRSWRLIKWGAGTRPYAREEDLLALICCGGVTWVELLDSLVVKLWDGMGTIDEL